MRTASCSLLKLFLVLIMMAFLFQAVSCEIACEPGLGKSGSATKAFFRLLGWEQWSLEHYPKWNKPRFLIAALHTIEKDDGVVVVSWNTKARFYGGQLCVATLTETRLEIGIKVVKKNISCHRFCLNDNDRLNHVITKNSSGYSLLNGTVPGSFWARKIYYNYTVFFVGKELRPRCIVCDDCSRNNNVTTLCPEGDQCFAVRLQESKSSNATVAKGCSSKLTYVGLNLYCDSKCANNVDLYRGNRSVYYSVCVSCCTGDSFNLHDDGTKNINSANKDCVHLISVLASVAVWFFFLKQTFA